ncbi:4-vinyl reductase 4VR [Thermocrinis albus DSM 14484]|uniref:4-vinyl reductase 4VR n=1 Tax=Thermocrinis albus (strain DSM 14484 / JCM 11386 / HI 11/12) TaxID=638303 RepID=D3SN68_THEAH|nr:V4R domain-containing protein [Thermocrinis albus]ADC90198.1 4-vinyl reductase 4VR [Thermocrinis albus DSM 14484]
MMHFDDLRIRGALRKHGFFVLKEPVQEFYKSMFRFTGIGLGGILHMAGKSAGLKAGRLILELTEGKVDRSNLRDVLEVFLVETGTIESIVEWEMGEDSILLSVKGSVFAEGMESKKPVCIPLQGGFAGVLEVLLGGRWEGKEIECKACGGEVCKFELRKVPS